MTSNTKAESTAHDPVVSTRYPAEDLADLKKQTGIRRNSDLVRMALDLLRKIRSA